MRAGWRFGPMILLLSTIAACGGGDDTTAPKTEEITGTWRATRVEYVSKTSPAAVELIAAGCAATLLLDPNHTFQFTVTPASGTPAVTTGTWQLDSDTMTMTPSGMPFSWQFDVALSAGSLRLTGASVEYDCDGDGVAEEAVLNLVLVR